MSDKLREYEMVDKIAEVIYEFHGLSTLDLAAKIAALLNISNVWVQEDCEKCDGGGYKQFNPHLNPNIFGDDSDAIKCSCCNGTGKITRPATPNDVDIVGMIKAIMYIEDHGIIPPNIDDLLISKKGGVLRVKE